MARLEAEARTVEHELSTVHAAVAELDASMAEASAAPPDVALRQAVGQSRLAGESQPPPLPSPPGVGAHARRSPPNHIPRLDRENRPALHTRPTTHRAVTATQG